MKTLQRIKPKYSIVSGDLNNLSSLNPYALEALKTANVILYDELVNPEMFRDFVDENKRFFKILLNDNFEERSEVIQQLVLELSYQFGHVVHIKGIDFNLIGEDLPLLDYAGAFNIETNVISLGYTPPQMILN
jgi:uroporphyrin-III C-methyltransferase